MKPTYQILPDYSHLFTGLENKDLLPGQTFEGGAVLPKTIDLIKEAYRRGTVQVRPLAEHLKGDSFRQSCYNIYHFVTENIRYKKDTPGNEEVRTPSRSYADRFTGVDCEDYAILIGGLLTNMGYEPRFEVVGFSLQGVYSHIFCVAYHNGLSIPIDTTPYLDGLGPVVEFGKRPQGITTTMNLRLLGAIEYGSQTPMIAGLGGIPMPVTALTKRAMDDQTEAIARFSVGAVDEETPKMFRKARYQIMLNGLPEAPTVHGIMGLVDDIDALGQLVLKPGVEIESVGELSAVLHGWGLLGFREDAKMIELEGLGGIQFNKQHPEYNRYLLEGIGNWFKKAFNKVKGAVKKAGGAVAKAGKFVGKTVAKGATITANAVKKGAQAVAKGVVTFVKDPLYYINKINPATILIRNAVLAVLRLNMFKVSSRLKYGYLSDEQVKAKGYNPDQHKKLKGTISTLENIFHKLGGEKVNLKNAIVKGGGGIGSLGEPATAATTAAATPIIIKIVQALKSIDFGAFFGKNATEEQKGETTVTIDENTVSEDLKSAPLTSEDSANQAQEMMNAKAAPPIDPATFNNPAEMAKAYELSQSNLLPANFNYNSAGTDGGIPTWAVIAGIAVVGGLTLYGASK